MFWTRTTRHIGYQILQTCRKMAECIFGWGKQHGIAAVSADFMLNLTAYNLVRIPKLIAAEAESARKPENQLRQTENPTTNEETAWLPQVFSANC